MNSIKPECLQSLDSEFRLKCSVHGLLEIMKYPQLVIHNEHGEDGRMELFGLVIDANNNYPKDAIIVDNGKLQYHIMTEDLCEYLGKDARENNL